jgi:twinkle protein
MISEKHLKGILDRGLSAETAEKFELYSGRHLYDGSGKFLEMERDPEGNVLCFPYFELGVEVNTKYRWAQRDKETGELQRCFMQRKGAKKLPFNVNVLLNEATMSLLESGSAPLIWTEGEFDCMAADECGFDTSISVPDGAPPGRDAKGRIIEVPDDDHDVNPEDDDKYVFMHTLKEYLDRVKYHIIATDNDDSGRRLAKELVRRIGATRCLWIKYPEEEVVADKKTGELRAPKDLNEVKKHLGDEVVREIIEGAREWPIRGLYKLSDYPDQDLPVMCEPGITPELDEMMKIYAGQFIVGTGVPNIGKSRFFNNLFVNMAKIHKWPITIFSGESQVKPFLARELGEIYLGKAPDRWTSDDRKVAHAFVERFFSFIDYDPRTFEGEIDVDTVLDHAATAVFRYGTKMLVLDPWNELEHKRDRNVSLTEYVGLSIQKMKRFARSFDCAVCVIAHPHKLETGVVPSLYHVSDSAHWANKPDLGVVIHADDPKATDRQVHIKKVRFKRIAGNVGVVPVTFDMRTGRFKKPELS